MWCDSFSIDNQLFKSQLVFDTVIFWYFKLKINLLKYKSTKSHQLFRRSIFKHSISAHHWFKTKIILLFLHNPSDSPGCQPTVEDRALRSKPPLVRHFQQRVKVIVFRQCIPGLVIQAIVHRYVAITLRPQQRQQVDAFHHRMVFARPMPLYPFDFLGIRFVQRRIIRHQDPAASRDLPPAASRQSVAGLGSRRCGRRVKASCAGGLGCSGRTRAASVALHTFGVAIRKLM